MKKGNIILGLVIFGFGILQFIRPNFKEYESPREPIVLEGVPPVINNILENSCFNCHSSRPNLAWYDKVTPVNFLVNSHIQKATAVLNFSNWDSLAPGTQKGKLYYSLNKVLAGEMPLPSYTLAHPSSKINEEQLDIIKNYLIGITSRPLLDTTSNNLQNPKSKHSQSKKLEPPRNAKTTTESQNTAKDYNWVAKSPNGIAYIPDYRNWKVISTTDRFDNGTIRIIFANQDAVEAIRDNKTNPWPNGSILAKVLWKQQQATQGQISTGKFIHVEYMIKDTEKYADTEGWGWARWKGEQLTPYGNTADFVQECIRCHSPVKDNDNVFTIPLNLVQLQKSQK